MTQTEKYIWLLSTVHNSRYGLTFRQISEKWEDNKELSTGKPLDRTTFNRWREAINLQFHVWIECDKKDHYRYKVQNPEDIENNYLNKWMLNSVSMGTTLMGSMAIKDRIILENIPTANEHLTTVISAMKGNNKLQITFRPFGSVYSYTFSVNPYFVKLFHNRWYMVAYNEGKKGMRTYCLDRLEEIEILDEKFRMPGDFIPNEYFSKTYGVSHIEGCEPYTIVLRVQEQQKYYFMSLPMHKSQRLIADEGDYADFELKLVPTDEFFFEILKNGSYVEIISPKEVVEQMKDWVDELYHVYNK